MIAISSCLTFFTVTPLGHSSSITKSGHIVKPFLTNLQHFKKLLKSRFYAISGSIATILPVSNCSTMYKGAMYLPCHSPSGPFLAAPAYTPDGLRFRWMVQPQRRRMRLRRVVAASNCSALISTFFLATLHLQHYQQHSIRGFRRGYVHGVASTHKKCSSIGGTNGATKRATVW